MSLNLVFVVTSHFGLRFGLYREFSQGCILVDERAIRNWRSDNATF